jgi:hypothetical protein
MKSFSTFTTLIDKEGDKKRGKDRKEKAEVDRQKSTRKM